MHKYIMHHILIWKYHLRCHLCLRIQVAAFAKSFLEFIFAATHFCNHSTSQMDTLCWKPGSLSPNCETDLKNRLNTSSSIWNGNKLNQAFWDTHTHTHTKFGLGKGFWLISFNTMHTFHSRIPLIPSCSRWHLFSQPLRVSVAKGSWTLTWIHLTYAINTYQTYGWCTEITPFKLFTLLTLILEAALKGNISSLQWAHRKIVNELSTRDHKFYSPSVIISYSSNYWIIIYICKA